MGLIRCTCIYRIEASEPATEGDAVLAVVARDPWCPAGDLHTRTAQTARQPVDEGTAG